MSLIGKTAEARLRVSSPGNPEDMRLPAGEAFPEVVFNSVVASSRLVALMELAAARLMQPQLLEGETSTCVEMNVMHLVATTSGDLRAVATYLGTAGRLHHFRVHVFDESGLVGSAEHTRAVLLPSGLLAGARRRAGRPAMLVNV